MLSFVAPSVVAPTCVLSQRWHPRRGPGRKVAVVKPFPSVSPGRSCLLHRSRQLSGRPAAARSRCRPPGGRYRADENVVAALVSARCHRRPCPV